MTNWLSSFILGFCPLQDKWRYQHITMSQLLAQNKL